MNKFLGKISPFMCISNWTKCGGYPYRTTLCLEKTFPQATPQRLRIPMSRPMRAYQVLPWPWHSLRHKPLSQVPVSQGEPISGCQGLDGQNFGSEWLLASNPTTPDLAIWTTIITHWLFGLGGRKCLFFFRAKEITFSHLTSKEFVHTLSKLKLKAAIHLFSFPVLSLNSYIPWGFSENISNKVMACS